MLDRWLHPTLADQWPNELRGAAIFPGWVQKTYTQYVPTTELKRDLDRYAAYVNNRAVYMAILDLEPWFTFYDDRQIGVTHDRAGFPRPKQ